MLPAYKDILFTARDNQEKGYGQARKTKQVVYATFYTKSNLSSYINQNCLVKVQLSSRGYVQSSAKYPFSFSS
jgi:hypothetical protein